MTEDDQLPGEAATWSRRTVLKFALVGLIGSAVGAGSTAAIARLVRKGGGGYRFFTEEEAALLTGICDQLIPRDDVPGAAETGAIHYIDRQLGGRLSRHQQTYRRGLESFGRTCLQEYKTPFNDLSTPGKIAALHAIEEGRAPTALWGDLAPQAFFNLVLAHTMQGFYGSPRHGGNRDYASYRMLGLDYPQFVGQNRYPKTS